MRFLASVDNELMQMENVFKLINVDLNNNNFGIQEFSFFSKKTLEIFPGCPTIKDGAMWPNNKPGLGIDINEDLAKKFPFNEYEYGGSWDTVRRSDGTVVKP